MSSRMTYADLLRQRLHAQHVSGKPLESPEVVVRWLGAVQAQDYAAAKWALGLRTKRSADSQVEGKFAAGALIRTHVMRPTWHFVAPEDIRWLLKLTAPRVNAICTHYYRKFEIDDRVSAKSSAALIKALAGGRRLVRGALGAALERARILRPGDDSLRLVFLLLRAELDGVICSGPKEGKQFTYMLLEERVPKGRALSPEEARAELTRRYFISHGPATLKDFSWWSGLSMPDVRAGVAAVEADLDRMVVDGQTYFHSGRSRPSRSRSNVAYLIPAYDESVLSYRDSRVPLQMYSRQLTRDIGQVIVIDGRTVGTWRRRLAKDAIAIEATPFGTLKRREKTAIADAADGYARFHGSAVSVRFLAP